MCINCKFNSIECPYRVEFGLMSNGLNCPHFMSKEKPVSNLTETICIFCGGENTNHHLGKLYCKKCEEKWR